MNQPSSRRPADEPGAIVKPVAIAELHTINMDFTKRTAVSAADRRTSGKRLR